MSTFESAFGSLDVSGLDDRVQRMRSIESTWSHPSLPDEVKLDLLAQPELGDSGSLGEFLWGLDSDIRAAVAPRKQVAPQPELTSPVGNEPVAVQEQVTVPTPGVLFMPEDSTTSGLRRAWHGVAGLRAPEIITPNATEELKVRAIEAGLLPENTPIDSRWDPQLEGVRFDLMNQDFGRRLQGDKPGSVRNETVLDMVDKWLSPSGLLSAAVALDFVPDFKAIGQEWSSWGDKWRKARETDSVKDYWDALLGPIDDVVVPIINDVLLFTGISEVVAFARGAQLAARGVNVIRGLEGVSVLGRGVRAVDVAAEVERFRSAGMIASRLQRTTSLRPLGDLMASWRRHTGVMMTKKAVQQGMKLGFIGQVENVLTPGQTRQELRVEQFKQWRTTNPLTIGLSMALEVPLAPVSIFKPGTFTRPAQALSAGIKNAFTKVSRDELLTSEFFNAGSEWLRVRDPERFRKLTESARRSDPHQALVAALGNGDEARTGEVMSHIVVSAAIDKAAKTKAAALADPDRTEFWGLYHLFRNKFINQIRPIADLADDETDLVRYAAQRANIGDRTSPGELKAWLDDKGDVASEYRRTHRDVYKQLKSELFSEDEAVRTAARRRAGDEIAHHNEFRQGSLNDVLDVLEDGDIAAYSHDVWETVDNWDEFVTANRMIDEAVVNGDLDDVGFIVPKDNLPVDVWDWRPAPLANKISGTVLESTAKGSKTGWAAFFSKDIDPTRGQFTLMRADSVTKQQAMMLHRHTRRLLEKQKALRAAVNRGGDDLWASVGQPLAARAAREGVALGDVEASVLSEWVRALTPPGTVTGVNSKVARQYAHALRWVARAGGDPADALRFVDDEIRTIANSDVWAATNLNIRTGIPLERQVKELGRRMKFVAAEVDAPAATKARLAEKGYKLVHGVDFLFPKDLVALDGPFAELHHSHLRRVSLGNFLNRHSREAVNRLRERRFKAVLSSELAKADVQGLVLNPESPDVVNVLGELWNERRRLLEVFQAAEEAGSTSGVVTRFLTRATHTGVPHSIYDMPRKTVVALFEPTLGRDGAVAVVSALRKAKEIGWQYEGLTGIESHLVANSWVRSALKSFSKTDMAESLGSWRSFKRAGIGVLSGALAYSQGLGVPGALAVGAGTAAAPGLASRVPGPVGRGLQAAGQGVGRNVLRFAGARAAAGVAAGAGADDNTSLGVGLLAGAALGPGARRALSLIDTKSWFQYSRIGDGLAHLRDRLRFSLNPFFDMQRYTESAVLAATADLPSGVTIPLNPSLSKFRKTYPVGSDGVVDASNVVDDFKAASRGWFDLDQVESTQAWFYEHGIMGYSPTKWMASAYGHLVNQGVDKAQAVTAVRNLYTYGVEGRSAAELSVNFVFFPFSFQKKITAQVAKFLAKDLGRTVMIHDALKAYEVLNERFNLSEELKEHLPILEQLRKFNAFAYGINPGELGGVNRPIIDAYLASPLGEMTVDPILNLFLPQGVAVRNEKESRDLQRIATRLVPAYRDVERLLQNTAEQGHVLFSQSHMSSAAETERAWDEWTALKQQVEEFAQSQGVSYSTVMRAERFAPVKLWVDQQRRAIEERFPAWGRSRDESVANAVGNQREISQIAADPQNAAEAEFAQFSVVVDTLSESLRSQGVSLSDEPELIPEQVYNGARQVAIAMAKRTPGFDQLYRRYYARMFGPIHLELQ